MIFLWGNILYKKILNIDVRKKILDLNGTTYLMQEDTILRMLREEKGDCKWSEIASIMKNQYGIEGRNGKQCRER